MRSVDAGEENVDVEEEDEEEEDEDEEEDEEDEEEDSSKLRLSPPFSLLVFSGLSALF